MKNKIAAVATVAAVLMLFAGCIASIGNRGAAPETTPEPPAAQEDPGRYRIETVQLDGGGWALLKYLPDTGEAWYSSFPDNESWIPILDAVEVPQSHYVFQPGQGNGSAWSVIRLDTRNGRTWVTRDSTWVEIVDPQAENS